MIKVCLPAVRVVIFEDEKGKKVLFELPNGRQVVVSKEFVEFREVSE